MEEEWIEYFQNRKTLFICTIIWNIFWNIPTENLKIFHVFFHRKRCGMISTLRKLVFFYTFSHTKILIFFYTFSNKKLEFSHVSIFHVSLHKTLIFSGIISYFCRLKNMKKFLKCFQNTKTEVFS